MNILLFQVRQHMNAPAQQFLACAIRDVAWHYACRRHRILKRQGDLLHAASCLDEFEFRFRITLDGNRCWLSRARRLEHGFRVFGDSRDEQKTRQAQAHQ